MLLRKNISRNYYYCDQDENSLGLCFKSMYLTLIVAIFTSSFIFSMFKSFHTCRNINISNQTDMVMMLVVVVMWMVMMTVLEVLNRALDHHSDITIVINQQTIANSKKITMMNIIIKISTRLTSVGGGFASKGTTRVYSDPGQKSGSQTYACNYLIIMTFLKF